MPLLYAKIGEEYTVGRVGGTESVRLHLENLGFTVRNYELSIRRETYKR